MYPEYAEINSERYKINTDYKVALRCFEVVENEDITDTERALAVLYLLFGFIPEENADIFLEKASLYLQCGKTTEEVTAENKDMDLIQDESYIVASFMSDYKIDLSKESMHYWRYVDLIKGLTEHCVLSKVREIRNYDLSDIKDAKTRNRIIKAKEAVALKTRLTKEEQEALEEFEKLFV